MKFPTLATLAAAATLALPSQAEAQWAKESVSVDPKGPYLTRFEGGAGPINYAFLDFINDGTKTTHFAQAQMTQRFGTKAIKPTIGLELQITNDKNIYGGQDLARAQVGLDTEWKNGFAGLRIAPRIDALGLGPDNDLQVSVNGEHTFKDVGGKGKDLTVGAWYDSNINRGQKPFIVGEASVAYKVGAPRGVPIEAIVYVPRNIGNANIRFGARATLK